MVDDAGEFLNEIAVSEREGNADGGVQIGMVCGHWTAVPINWWLIQKGVKEPCA